MKVMMMCQLVNMSGVKYQMLSEIQQCV